MLQALYRYADDFGLAMEPGFSMETIKASIWLSSQGPQYIGLHMENSAKTLCPDVGSKNQSPDCSHVLFDYPVILFPGKIPQVHEDTAKKAERKHRFFTEALRSAADWEPTLSACLWALETPEVVSAILEDLKQHGVRPDKDFISFRVDNTSVLEQERVKTWWRENRKMILGETVRGETLCLISGQPTAPRKLPKLTGLTDVGAQGKVPLFSFDKRAYQSYGLQKEENAPVSEEAVSAVNAALNALIAEAPPAVANIKFIHWFSRYVPTKQDPIWEPELNFFLLDDDKEDDGADEDFEAGVEKSSAEYRREAREAKGQADSVVNSIRSGEYAAVPEDTRYYILLLSGVKGRVMIRRFEEGNYYVLRGNLERWREELELCNPYGTAPVKPCKLTARLIRLLSYADSQERIPSKLYEKMGKALSGITADIIHAIMTGGPLPDAAAAKALAYLRSGMLSSNEDSRSANSPDATACQWLKVWLMRNHKEELKDVYNYENPSAAYHSGGLMALYAGIQEAGLGDVGANVVQRYYAAASQSPALAIGQLSRLANYHLGKMDKGLAVWYQRKIEDVVSAIPGNAFPAALDLRGQSLFALGYYQMGAMLTKERMEARARKQEKAALSQGRDTQITMELDSGMTGVNG